jgi:hypothetical protein
MRAWGSWLGFFRETDPTASPPVPAGFLFWPEEISVIASFTSDDELAAIARGVMDLSLPKSAWTHRAHFAAALWLLTERPDLDLPRVMPGLIRAYNVATGVANSDSGGYHETITQASLRAARSFLASQRGIPLHAVCNALTASALGRPDWMLVHWTTSRLFSVAARRNWVDPDLVPLPYPAF